ncbi:MAG: hypothetical protein SOT46_05280 [Treponema sp.]|nr:hypothetical protein [Treponema sp.]
MNLQKNSFNLLSLRQQQYCPLRLTACMCRSAVGYTRLLVRSGLAPSATADGVK